MHNLPILGGAAPSLALALLLLAVTFVVARRRSERGPADLAAIDRRQRSSRASGPLAAADPMTSDFRPLAPR